MSTLGRRGDTDKLSEMVLHGPKPEFYCVISVAKTESTHKDQHKI